MLYSGYKHAGFMGETAWVAYLTLSDAWNNLQEKHFTFN